MNINQILTVQGFSLKTIQLVIDAYSEEHRYYHDINHIKEMLLFIEDFKNQLNKEEYKALQLAVIFHDIIYVPLSQNNEENSYELFLEEYKNNKYYNEITKELVKEMILATKNHDLTTSVKDYIKIIIRADLNRFNASYKDFWKHNINLCKEYDIIEWDLLKPGRINFLENYKNKIQIILGNNAYENCSKAIEQLKLWEPKIAVYPGSFAPFHIGHENILNKANKIFDKVIIAIGKNPAKINKIAKINSKIRNKFQVEEYNDDMITDYIQRKSYPLTIIRGLRNSTDLQQEITTYRYWKDAMPDIQVISIFCDAEFEHVSSTGIRSTEEYYKRINKKSPYEI